ncbi:MAG: vitamin K epoxide reductase family protein [Caldilineales bacterium]|nr:vitamin K epoxide reductase family protein [Caldilineales bacterium]
MTLALRRGLLLQSLFGIVLAGYLSWVKFTDTEAVCGGIGDCSSVQNSIYAYLFGIPVAYLGLLTYLGLTALLLLGLWRGDLAEAGGDLLFFALVFFGFIFSAYLTYTEFFLIRAICPWCLVSFLNLTLMAILAGRATLAGEAMRG